MKGDSAEAQDISSTATLNQRRTSFVDMCQSAIKRIGSQKDAAEHIRSKPVGELLPAAEGSSAASGKCQAPASSLAAREPVLPQSPSNGEDDHARDFHMGVQDGCTAMTQGSERAKTSGEEEVTALRELLQRQKEDLEMAASIGQQLLDSNDDLSIKLEAAREDKWLADCESEALRRDLEHATQRCEQLDDIQIEAAPETEVEGMDLWSPAAAGRGATRASISDAGCVIPAAYGTPKAAAAAAAAADDDDDRPERRAQQREADGLRRAVEGLQQANSMLREELVEARLEATALRHTSVAHGQAARDQERREAFDEDNEQQYQQRQQHLGGAGVSASEKPWAAGSDNDGSRPLQGGGGWVRGRRSSARLRVSENNEPQILGEVYDGENGPSPEDQTEEKPEHELRERLPCEKGEGRHRGVSDNSSGGDESKVKITEAATTTTTTTLAAAPTAARLRRCQSSSAFKDTEEQAELIDALREQVSQLRLQAQLSGTSRASAAVRGARHGQSGATGYNPHDSENTGPRWSQSKCSSDDDSESDRGRQVSDDITHSPWPKCARKERLGCNSVGGDGSDSGRIGGDHVKTGGNGGRADDALNLFVLRGRVSELSSELEAARCALDALRQRAKQQQATNVELQREILRLHVARHNGNSARMSEEVARVSALASPPGHTHHTVHHDHGRRNSNGGGVGSDSSGGQHPIDCFKTHGLSWLSWLWRILIGAREDDGAANGIEGRSFVDEAEAEKGGGCCSSGDCDGDFAAGGDDGGTDNGASWDGGERDDPRGSLIHERAALLNNEGRERV